MTHTSLGMPKGSLFLFLLILCVFSSCSSQDAENEKARVANSTPPNIVVIYLDDLGYGDVSAYGATELNTPNIDALANGGVKFTNAYASSATCTPSRYALLTGMYPGSLLNTKMVREAFGRSWSPADKGASILCELAVDKNYEGITAKYYDNDQGGFGYAHPDVYDEQKIEALLHTTRQVVGEEN